MIRHTSTGLAVIENDDWISRWVEEKGSLQHDYQTLPIILEYINEGDTVIDIGAHIGDTAGPFKDKVGDKGTVIAFEPNPEAFACLQHNCPGVICFNVGLSDVPALATLKIGQNSGAAHLEGNNGEEDSEEVEKKTIFLTTLDSRFNEPHCDFIKIDAEGCELKILQGAKKTIRKFRPKMALELSENNLRRQEAEIWMVLAYLSTLNYQVFPISCPDRNQPMPQYDVLAFPI